MSKGYITFPVTEKFLSSHKYLLDNDKNALSLNAGTAFPDNPLEGMLCYRTDEEKIYIKKQMGWIEILNLNKMPLVKEDFDRFKKQLDKESDTFHQQVNTQFTEHDGKLTALDQKITNDISREISTLNNTVTQQFNRLGKYSRANTISYNELLDKPDITGMINLAKTQIQWSALNGKPSEFYPQRHSIERLTDLKKYGKEATVAWNDLTGVPQDIVTKSLLNDINGSNALKKFTLNLTTDNQNESSLEISKKLTDGTREGIRFCWDERVKAVKIYNLKSKRSPMGFNDSGGVFFWSDVFFAHYKITGLGDPKDDEDGANKKYVDDLWKNICDEALNGEDDRVKPLSQLNLQNYQELVNTVQRLQDKVTALESKKDAIYVVEKGGNSTKWYRKWSDGWLEQGGKPSVVTDQDITFMKTYKEAPQVFFTRVSGRDGCSYDSELYPRNITTTKFKMYMNTFNVNSVAWYACGYGA